MIEKFKNIPIDMNGKPSVVWLKINELVDAVNGILAAQEQYATIYKEDIVPMLTPENTTNSKMENVAENGESSKMEQAEGVQNDHYWYKQQERHKAALVLIRNLSGAGMSYHDMCIESREIAKWALDPDYKPLLIGRYSKDDQELFDALRETKGGDNE